MTSQDDHVVSRPRSCINNLILPPIMKHGSETGLMICRLTMGPTLQYSSETAETTGRAVRILPSYVVPTLSDPCFGGKAASPVH